MTCGFPFYLKGCMRNKALCFRQETSWFSRFQVIHPTIWPSPTYMGSQLKVKPPQSKSVNFKAKQLNK